VELPEALLGKRTAVRALELGEKRVLPALVDEVVALLGLVLLQPAHELEAAVEDAEDLEVRGGDLTTKLPDERVGAGIAWHQAKI
jgi:hypothetical protein